MEAEQSGHDGSGLLEPPDRGLPGARTPAGFYASAQLDPLPAAAGRARRLTRDALARWGMEALTDDTQAIASELAANAAAAVPPGTPGLAIVYAIHAAPPGLRLYAWDIGPGRPDRADPDADAETGRGLAIIDALTGRNWGWWPTPASGGKVVWAALAAPTTPTAPATAKPDLRGLDMRQPGTGRAPLLPARRADEVTLREWHRGGSRPTVPHEPGAARGGSRGARSAVAAGDAAAPLRQGRRPPENRTPAGESPLARAIGAKGYHDQPTGIYTR